MKVVQQQLKDLWYLEVDTANGGYGPRTRAAALAFRADKLGVSLDADPILTDALQQANGNYLERRSCAFA